MDKVVIVAIVGESGSGKTFAAQYMGLDDRFHTIVSYTTRSMRVNETDGVDHWFVTNQDVPAQSEMCAYTVFGDNQYWTTWSQFADSSVCHLYVIDENGVDFLRSKVAEAPFAVSLVLVRIKRADLSDIDSARRFRDKDRFLYGDDVYDFVLQNDGSLEDFRGKLDELKESIVEYTGINV